MSTITLAQAVVRLGYALPLQLRVTETTFAFPENFVVSQKGDLLRGSPTHIDDPAGTWMNQGIGGDNNTVNLSVQLVDAKGDVVVIPDAFATKHLSGSAVPANAATSLAAAHTTASLAAAHAAATAHTVSKSGGTGKPADGPIKSATGDAKPAARSSSSVAIPLRMQLFYSKLGKLGDVEIDRVHLGLSKDKNSRRIGAKGILAASCNQPLVLDPTATTSTVCLRVLQTSAAHRRNKFFIEVWPDFDRLSASEEVFGKGMFESRDAVLAAPQPSLPPLQQSPLPPNAQLGTDSRAKHWVHELRMLRGCTPIAVMSKINKKKMSTIEQQAQLQLKSALDCLGSSFADIAGKKDANPNDTNKSRGKHASPDPLVSDVVCKLEAHELRRLLHECDELEQVLFSAVERRKKAKLSNAPSTSTTLTTKTSPAKPTPPQPQSPAPGVARPDEHKDAAAILPPPPLAEAHLSGLKRENGDIHDPLQQYQHPVVQMQPFVTSQQTDYSVFSEEKQTEDEVYEALRSAFEESSDQWDISIIRCSLSPEGLFFTLDASREGWLNEYEVADALRVLGVPLSGHIAKTTMSYCDKNKDGRVDKDEFIEYIHFREQQLFEMFTLIDRDCDGILTLEELQEARNVGVSQLLLSGTTDKDLVVLISWMSSVVGCVSRAGSVAGASLKRPRLSSCHATHQSVDGTKEGETFQVDFEGFKTSLTLIPPSMSLKDLAVLLSRYQD